jgi:hypothetical protein
METFFYVSGARWDVVREQVRRPPWRFMQKPRVVFVEEPMGMVGLGVPKLDVFEAEESADAAEFWIARLLVPFHENRSIQFGDPVAQPIYDNMLIRFIEQNNYRDSVLWICDLKALTFANLIPYRFLVYDTLNGERMEQNIAIQRVHPNAAALVMER